MQHTFMLFKLINHIFMYLNFISHIGFTLEFKYIACVKGCFDHLKCSKYVTLLTSYFNVDKNHIGKC